VADRELRAGALSPDRIAGPPGRPILGTPERPSFGTPVRPRVSPGRRPGAHRLFLNSPAPRAARPFHDQEESP